MSRRGLRPTSRLSGWGSRRCTLVAGGTRQIRERPMRFMRLVWVLLAISLVVAGCNRDADETSPSTVPPAVAPTTAPSVDSEGVSGLPDSVETIPSLDDDSEDGSVGTEDATTAATTATVSGLPTYEVVHRMIEDDRETLVIVVEPGAYSAVELENLVYDVVERFVPSAAIVVDDRTAADLAILEERTEDDQRQLDTHTLLRIENGVEVSFYGPYADIPGLTVGS